MFGIVFCPQVIRESSSSSSSCSFSIYWASAPRTVSFADPTVLTRTVSGNWIDTTGWTPAGVPNGNTVTAQLVNPGSGTNSMNLGGGTFPMNQLQFSGTNSGTWNVTNGTIIFDGTNPTF